MFENDLYELCLHLGRPVPEFQGACVDASSVEGLCWLIESSVRGRIEHPRSKKLVHVTMDSSWADGLGRAMQRMLARLCDEHRTELKDSRFRYFGRRNGDGHPTPADHHSLFGEYISDMEVMVYRTQEDLRSSRLQAHFQRISLKESRSDYSAEVGEEQLPSQDAPSEADHC